MSSENQPDDVSSFFVSSEISLSRPVRFWLMILFNIPSIICSCCIMFHILIDGSQRQALHNHTILLILIFGLPVQLIDIPFYLAFFIHGSVQPAKPVICLLWWLSDFGFYIGGVILMSWLAIERHILIFNDGWVSTRRGRFLFHYLPLILILMYIVLFYGIAIFLLPCRNTYEYSVPVCGASPCYEEYGILGMWEFVINTTVPIVLESVVSIGLVLRVLWQKRRLRQSSQWRKQRRMMIQLFLVSGLNTSLNLPIQLIPLAHLFGLPPQYGVQPQLYFFFLGYFVVFLFPFASLSQYPNLRKKIKKRLLCDTSDRPRHHTAIVEPRMGGATMA